MRDISHLSEELQAHLFLFAPWSDDEVAILNAVQIAGRMAAYTCDEDGTHAPGYLTATRNGWLCPTCGYTQGWTWRGYLEPWARRPQVYEYPAYITVELLPFPEEEQPSES